MDASIDYSTQDKKFWAEYEQLWQHSIDKPVFQAPALLRYFAGIAGGTLAIFKCYRENQLAGAAFFHREKGAYTFLSDLKTDHNCFVIRRDCSDAEIAEFFKLFHQKVEAEKWTLVLNNKPMWASYMETFARAGKKSDLFWLSAQSGVCPRLEEKTPDSLLKNLLKSRNNRYKRNRLLREQNAEFEVLNGTEDLDAWASDFCNTHVARWEGTITPSKYRSDDRRQFLLGCLEAWAKDERLVRFALKVDGKRIAFVIGLVQENSLIYHSLTYHPDFHKYSPGKVLLLYLGEWMQEHQLHILDFGDGNEPYKYDFANKERKLHSVFIAPKMNILFILKAKFTALVRNNPVLIRFYREKLRPVVKYWTSRAPLAQMQRWLFLNLHLLLADELPAIPL